MFCNPGIGTPHVRSRNLELVEITGTLGLQLLILSLPQNSRTPQDTIGGIQDT